jgi:hypothetical protein
MPSASGITDGNFPSVTLSQEFHIMTDDTTTGIDVDSFLSESTPAEITPQSALDEIQKRYHELTPLRARSQASLGLFLGSIHEMEPVFQSEEGRKALEEAVQEQPSVRKSRTYVTAKKSVIHLLLVKYLGLDIDGSQRLGYEQAVQAGHSQPRTAESFARWLKAAGGVQGARRMFRKLKQAGAFPESGAVSAKSRTEESAIAKLAKNRSLSGVDGLLPESLPAEVHIAEGYFIVIGHAAKDETGTLKSSTVGLWDRPAIVEAAAKAVDKENRASKQFRKKIIVEAKKTTAYWRRKNKEGYRGGATLDQFFEAAEQEADALQQEEIKEIEEAVRIDATDDQDDQQSDVDEAPQPTDA